jgi:hypothetical protein
LGSFRHVLEEREIASRFAVGRILAWFKEQGVA